MLQQFEDNFDSLFSKYDSYKIRLKNLTNFLSKSDESVDRIFDIRRKYKTRSTNGQ